MLNVFKKKDQLEKEYYQLSGDRKKVKSRKKPEKNFKVCDVVRITLGRKSAVDEGILGLLRNSL